jgi:hypothetical protein
MTLINDIILKAGLIERIGNSDRPVELEVFKGISYYKLFFTFILPLICFIFLAFILKRKYETKKRKDEITLNGFYIPDED